MIIRWILILKLDRLFNGSLKLKEKTCNSWIYESSMHAMEEIYEAFEGVDHFEPKKLH